MNLEEGLLERVLGDSPIPTKADQEPHQVIVVAADEFLEGGGIARPIIGEELLVGAIGSGPGAQDGLGAGARSRICGGTGWVGLLIGHGILSSTNRPGPLATAAARWATP